MAEFQDKYNFKDSQEKWLADWKDDDSFKWDKNLPADLDYVIDTPPPTVSGTLHVGHVYSYTQADIIARYFRMSGRNVLYPIGWDDNGLPTERLVEKVKKVRGGTMSREEFVALCREVIPEYHEQFRNLFGRLALSVDWSREYQTISDESRAISQLSFVDLFNKGLLERRLEPALWDPADRTAIAQAEVDELEQTGVLNTVAFGVEDGDEVLIATTRPELLAGVGALMIHPDHPRASELVGKNAISPMYHVPVPIIADETVDPEKGTGVVMCCTFGDVTDIQWWRTHDLPLRLAIDATGRMIETLPMGTEDWPSADIDAARATMAEMAGLKTKAAKAKMIELLKEDGALRDQQETRQVIPIAERSGAPLEIIVTNQWFIRTLDFKQELLEKGREINWHPSYMRQRFESWVEGLKWDWSISRQRHFGVSLPVWYSKRAGEEGKILLPDADQLPVDPMNDLPKGYSADEVTAETDVLDTWATSSVSPQMVTRSISPELGYDPDAHERLFPMAMRPQAHEIIRTWAFYTIVKSLHHQQELPWRDICISGWCLAEDGSKMSKSKNNIIDPIRLLDDYGTDAVRYWTGTSRLGNDTALATNTLKQGKRLVTKLWNASRLAHMSLERHKLEAVSPKADVESGVISHRLDIWVLGQLASAIEKATASFETYNYAVALKTIEDFFWHIHCDNYLELVKNRSRVDEGEPDTDQLSALHTLLHVTHAVVRLFAPFVPFVTEELAQHFLLEGEDDVTVHARNNWPKPEDHVAAESNADIGKTVLDILAATRKVRAELSVSRRAEIETLFVNSSVGLTDADLESVLEDLKATTVAQTITVGSFDSELPSAQSQDEKISVGLKMAPQPVE